MKKILLALTLMPTLALAQTITPAEQEIVNGHQICNQPDHFQPKNAGPPGMKQMPWYNEYKPEWKEACEAIDVEFNKLQLAKKQKDQSDLDKLNAIKSKIK